VNLRAPGMGTLRENSPASWPELSTIKKIICLHIYRNNLSLKASSMLTLSFKYTLEINITRTLMNIHKSLFMVTIIQTQLKIMKIKALDSGIMPELSVLGRVKSKFVRCKWGFAGFLPVFDSKKCFSTLKNLGEGSGRITDWTCTVVHFEELLRERYKYEKKYH